MSGSWMMHPEHKLAAMALKHFSTACLLWRAKQNKTELLQSQNSLRQFLLNTSFQSITFLNILNICGTMQKGKRHRDTSDDHWVRRYLLQCCSLSPPVLMLLPLTVTLAVLSNLWKVLAGYDPRNGT